ncbi:MAG: TonB-dependent receptor plug domain-containing protein [Bacteroidia bacterium]|nr:TonB-dependent receptor plug domain-containing protein [Bacteroidia bacterium]
MNRVLACCLVGLFSLALSAQDSKEAPPSPAIPEVNMTAITRLTNQLKSFPQEKVYLQLDRPYYSAGERLWFRAYLVHSAIHTSLNLSRYIYVELLNAHNDVIIRKKIRPTDEGLFFGQLDLTPELAEGWYSVRAYTNCMRNMDEAFFFRRNVYIGNGLRGLSGIAVNERTSSNMGSSALLSEDKEKATFDVQFFPEGGHLISGNMQILGFKSIGANGLGADVTGRIVDNTNKEVVAFKSSHLGMGKIILKPEAGKTYIALCEDNRGQKLSVLLPDVSSNNFSLCVQQTPSIMSIKVLTPEQSVRTDTLYLIGCLRGLPIFQTTIPPEISEYTFSSIGMNSGVTQLLLLNGKGEVLSERMVYVNGNDDAKVNLVLDKTNYKKRDAVHAALILKDSKENPIEGNFSVSITDDNDARIDSSETTIKSYMLLQSDLKGFIENPNRYFRPENKNASSELDILMLTQGWKRNDSKEVLVGNYAKCDAFDVERGQIIHGKVQNFPARRGLSGINVSMFFLKKMHYDGAVTGKAGRFEFLCPEFPDSTIIRIDATKKQGQFIELVIEPDSFPPCTISCVFPDNLKQNNLMKSFLKKSRDRYYYQNGMMSVTLDQVVVVAKKTDTFKKIREERGSLYSDPSYTIGEDALSTATSILDVLMMAPGVTQNSTGDGVLIRNAEPLVLVDNMNYNMGELRNINANEVKMIDILKEPTQTAIFGSKGANGVICVYLKRGNERTVEPVVLERNQKEILPLGYSLPAEFYVPKYQVESNKQNPLPDLRSTIYWKPNVKTNALGEADLFFFTADGTGTYTITAEGMAPNGEVIRYQGKMNRK